VVGRFTYISKKVAIICLPINLVLISVVLGNETDNI
jgi:hypothetical protein